jgi:hypothetical protein
MRKTVEIGFRELFVLAVLLPLYLVPFLIARSNIFLGWAMLGWLVAFIWACMNTTARESGGKGEPT